MPSVYSRLQCAALAGCLLLGAASSEAQLPVRQVLMLHSFNRGNLTIDNFTGNFRVDLDQRADSPVNVVQIVVGPTGFVGPSPYFGYGIVGGKLMPIDDLSRSIADTAIRDNMRNRNTGRAKAKPSKSKPAPKPKYTRIKSRN